MYATVEQFLAHYQSEETRELSNIDGETSSPTIARLPLALQMAASEINQIIGVRYNMPITVVVAFLTLANIVIGRKYLDSFDEREKTRKDYEDVILRLTAIASGESVLIDELGNIIPPKPDIVKADQFYHGRMYSGNMKCYQIDFTGSIYRPLNNSF